MKVYVLVEEWEEKGLEMEYTLRIYSSYESAEKEALKLREKSIKAEIEDNCDPYFYRIDEYEVIE